MASYVISDIHGQYDLLMEILDIIKFTESDTLYVLGDVLDRGPHPIKTLMKLMEMPNVICLAGNHELMALECLEFLDREVTDKTIDEVDDETLGKIVTWLHNGAQSTIDEYRELNPDMRSEVSEYINDFSVYEEVSAGEKNYFLVHAGLGNFARDKKLEEYTLEDFVWERADYEQVYFEDVYTVTGHTPTQMIKGNPSPGYIFRKNNHIAIDCGACFKGGRLAALCLDTGKEFYTLENANVI